MTVKDLIDLLSKVKNQEAEVHLYNDFHTDLFNVELYKMVTPDHLGVSKNDDSVVVVGLS